ncbi:M20 metallopeptidase family protein [Chryseolinea soli]|uniref:Amidohydrolase n=1 Tax=Chryseolinea soli TaxID=2321403 RepID=A0A385SWD4_9BACT|nr:M20 family metallopeptidase [Chryseolinea soli]AYB34477.1 amidohydrolase [Chryseolinea soli]
MLRDKIKALSAEILPEIIRIRRHLHQHPELSFQEQATSAYIKSQLDQIGISWRPIADTGVLAIIEGHTPASNVVALRADMDALPIQELNAVDYASKNPGVMHACGHDFHTSSLLGTAAILQRCKQEFNGTVKLLFQPAEEVLPGGATRMIKEGALRDPSPIAVIGQHAMPRLPAGKIGIRKGKHMASMDSLYVRIIGKGGHGAEPHTVIDPVVIAAHVIIALQQIISRSANPREPSVLSFGRVIANGAVNVIPDEVYMEGTFRAMNETWREKALGLIANMAEKVTSAMGGTCELRIDHGYPVLVNEERLAANLRDYAVDYLGEENVIDEDIWMAAEDFAYYGQVADSCFYLCGVGNVEKGITSLLHTPTFNVDESALGMSTGLMAYMALKKLGN